jgi:hypothetical protein
LSLNGLSLNGIDFTQKTESKQGVTNFLAQLSHWIRKRGKENTDTQKKKSKWT